jgi:hypothetical protein
MNDDEGTIDIEYVDGAPLSDPESNEVAAVPYWLEVWGHLVETLVSTIYFLLISSIAVLIDLGLHRFDALPWVERYKLSPVIRWEIELMAYTLATVDCFLFMRKLIQPIIEFVADGIRRFRS